MNPENHRVKGSLTLAAGQLGGLSAHLRSKHQDKLEANPPPQKKTLPRFDALLLNAYKGKKKKKKSARSQIKILQQPDLLMP